MNKKTIIGICIVFLLLIIPIRGFDIITGNLVKNPSGTFEIGNFPPVLEASDYTGDAGDLVTIIYNATDPNGDDIIVSFTSPLNSSGQWQSNESDHGIHSAIVTASDGNSETEQLVSIKLRPYCGDGVCNFATIGEYCGNCEEDCGQCPVPTPAAPASSGGGGGGGASVSEEYIENLKKEIMKMMGMALYNITDQFDINMEEIFVELQEYEFAAKSISINNYHINRTIIVGLDIIGEVKDNLLI